MEQAIIFDLVMMAIWDPNREDHDFLAVAVANKLRGTQRINPENACEVLQLVFPTAKCAPRLNEDAAKWEPNDAAGPNGSPLIFDVTFDDGSQTLIVADKYGCGHSNEYIGGPNNVKD